MTIAAPLIPPLSVSGADILGADGTPAHLAGVNWGGAHQDGRVPAGLDKLPLAAITARLASWEFVNHVRLPFALGTFACPDGSPFTGRADPARLAANPSLLGLTPWQVYQAVVAALTGAGIAVIPNQHLLYPGMCCSGADCNGLWYNDTWPSSVFTNTWVMLGEAFADNPMVIGWDLHNEPRPAVIGGITVAPTWGDGNAGKAYPTDMRQMYSNTAARLRAVDGGRKLMFCEGLSYASDLTRAGAYPVDGPGVVYSLHDYYWFHKTASGGQPSLADYMSAMDARGGYLMRDGIAPVWAGEFGIDTTSRANLTGGWLPDFAAWARLRGVHFCWWQMNAQTVLGHEPCTNRLVVPDGNEETYGLMAGQDWQGSASETIALLRSLVPARLGIT
jgi:endoglucanase